MIFFAIAYLLAGLVLALTIFQDTRASDDLVAKFAFVVAWPGWIAWAFLMAWADARRDRGA